MSVYNKYVKPYNNELEELLDTEIGYATKMYYLKATMNNVSRKLYKALCAGGSNDDRQVFNTRKGKYAFVLTTDLVNLQCRQFYEDLKGFICYNILTDKVYLVDKALGKEGKGFGTGNETLKACNKSVGIDEGCLLTLKDFEDFIYG